jgi:tetratricopeptide (TPR) repeat protein
VTYLDPEQGEAWTNIAALWMQLGAWRRAVSASEQAVRLKRDSWQAWDNYAAAAAKAGQWLAAVRAVQQVGARGGVGWG